MLDLSSFALGFHIVAAFHFATARRGSVNKFGFWWSVTFAGFAALCLVAQ